MQISRSWKHFVPWCIVAGVLTGCSGLQRNGASNVLHTFSKQTLTDEFWGEGAAFGDINRDGIQDVVAGPFWYQGPSFQQRHEFMPANRTSSSKRADGAPVTFRGYKGRLGNENEYSANFFAFTHDFDRDGWVDILILGFPGENSWWFKNPGQSTKPGSHWTQNVAVQVTDNESPHFIDITGDGRPEIVCSSKGFYGYASYDPANPAALFTWHNISPDNKYHKYTHGLGVGDVNGDGRKDLLEKNGWWEQPKSLTGDPTWQHHSWTFGVGGAQMYAYDVNGDGLNDVITSISGHGYGLSWFEQYRDADQIKFREHSIMNKEKSENPYGVAFSQLHAVDLIDMDGDGLKDIVTGKRFWAHGPAGDPGAQDAPVLYWFGLKRGADRSVEFVPHLVDSSSGVGTQVSVQDYNGDRKPDILVGNKHGVYVFTHQTQKVSPQEWLAAQPSRLLPR